MKMTKGLWIGLYLLVMLLPPTLFAVLFHSDLRDILVIGGFVLVIVAMVYFWKKNTKGLKLFNQWANLHTIDNQKILVKM